MIWNDIKKLYPNRFVKVEILKSHIDGDREYIDEMALVGEVDDDKATEELLKSKNGFLVYHTSKDMITLKMRTRIGLRRVVSNEN